jgi:NADPH2:quinone reductase
VDREVGERVVTLGGRAYAEYVVVPEMALFDVPEEMSFAEAAGFPVQWLTAHNCLFEWGGLEAGERVYVPAAAGGVGSAAVQLAADAGAEVFAAASTAEKLQFAADLGADHTVNYETEDFVERVDDLTDGEGVDLALEMVGGETASRTLEILPQFGRMVTYGVASGEPGMLDTKTLFFNNVEVYGYHLGEAMAAGPERVYEAVDHLTGLLADGTVEVQVGHRFPLAEAAEAHEFLESRQSSGKVVLEP